MDELRTVREAYGEPAPPTMREMAEARARMFDESPRRRLAFGWRFKAGLGALAAGAAAAVAIATIGSGAPASPGTPATGVDFGKQAVLTAAEKAAAQPTGKYWYSDVIDGQSYIVRSKSGAAYAITGAHREVFSWHGVKPGMGEMYYGRDLPARPQTARDMELWREDGSPTSFRVWSGDKYLTFTTKAPKWRSDVPNTGLDPKGGGKFALGMSPQELQNLPTDPAELSELLDRHERELMKRRSPRKEISFPPEVMANSKLRKAGALLDSPTPPKVRAGLIRMLTAEKGIHAIGHVTDPLGRRGVALATDPRAETVDGEFGTPESEHGTYRSRNVIVFNERSGALLSRYTELTSPGGPYRTQKPGFIINYELSRSSGWTDTKPSPPAEPPFRRH